MPGSVKRRRCLIEKVTQSKTDYPAATAIGGQNGVNHAREKAIAGQVHSRYRNAGRKEKSAILDEFIGITGYKNRKCALRLLNKPARAHTFLFVKGTAVKLKPVKPKPANRKDKKIYTDDIIARVHSLLIPAFVVNFLKPLEP